MIVRESEKEVLTVTVFERITESPEVLGKFLACLPVMEGPWDDRFHEQFCAGCAAENCDACPNEEFRNNPGWWLTLETGDNQDPAESAREIKITEPWADNGWITGKIGQFVFTAKVFGLPSKFGIDGGRVSKLEIKKGTTPVVNYDRGWDIEPESDEAREILRAVVEYLETLPVQGEGDEA